MKYANVDTNHISRHTDSQTVRARPPSSQHSFSPSNEEEGRIHWLSKDNRGEIQKQDFFKKIAKVTSTRRILPIYRWRRSQTDYNLSSGSPKSQPTYLGKIRSTSQDP